MTPIQTYTLPPDKLALAIHYALARHVLYFSSIAFSALVLLALLWFRVAPRLRTRRLPLVIAIVYALVALGDLPADMAGHGLSLHFGISIQSWPGWFADWLTAQAVTLPFMVLVLWGFYILVRRSPRRWWIYAWIACIPLILFSTWIEPFVLEPLFNHFEPLEATHPELVKPMEAVLARAGVSIPKDHLFEMQASAKTNALNAYVSGIGSSKRVVLYDTIIRKENGPALMTTFGHELGHYVLGHVAKGIVFAIALLLAGFWLAYRLIGPLVKWGARWDVRGVGDVGSLPLFGLLLLALSFFSDPIGNAFSRRQEHQADVYSLEITQGVIPDPGQAAAHAFQLEGETDLEPPNPSPFIVFWLYSHPPVAERLRFSATWHGG